MDSGQESSLNPWFSMWTRPRETIQKIVDSNPEHHVLLLSALAGSLSSLQQLSSEVLGNQLQMVVAIGVSVSVGAIIGVVSLACYGTLIHWTGRCLGGQAPRWHIYASLAWSLLPTIFARALVIVLSIGLFGVLGLGSDPPQAIHEHPLSLPILVLLILFVWGSVIWNVVLLCQSLGQVQGFSAWKALGNLILAGLLILGFMVIIFVIAYFFIFSEPALAKDSNSLLDRKAAQWFHHGAEQGDAEAQRILGDRYRSGHGVPKNDQMAVHWYRKAAEQGYSDAQMSLGSMYNLGKGVTQDSKAAFRWYLAAAKQGHADAQYNAGMMSALGDGVNKNYKIAYAWFSAAATQGDKGAEAVRDETASKLSPTELEEAQTLSRKYHHFYVKPFR